MGRLSSKKKVKDPLRKRGPAQTYGKPKIGDEDRIPAGLKALFTPQLTKKEKEKQEQQKQVKEDLQKIKNNNKAIQQEQNKKRKREEGSASGNVHVAKIQKTDLNKSKKIGKLDMQENESYRDFSKRLSEKTKDAIFQINNGISKVQPMRPSRKRYMERKKQARIAKKVQEQEEEDFANNKEIIPFGYQADRPPTLKLKVKNKKPKSTEETEQDEEQEQLRLTVVEKYRRLKEKKEQLREKIIQQQQLMMASRQKEEEGDE